MGEVVVNKICCVGYYDYNIFILCEYRDIFCCVFVVLWVVGDKFFYKCVIFSF